MNTNICSLYFYFQLVEMTINQAKALFWDHQTAVLLSLISFTMWIQLVASVIQDFYLMKL